MSVQGQHLNILIPDFGAEISNFNLNMSWLLKKPLVLPLPGISPTSHRPHMLTSFGSLLG